VSCPEINESESIEASGSSSSSECHRIILVSITLNKFIILESFEEPGVLATITS